MLKVQRDVIVLGMHRSGTSAISEMLTHFNLNVGALEDTIGGNQENAQGFWERRDVRKLNDEILFSLKCDWDIVSRFDLSDLSNEIFDGFVDDARKIILTIKQENSASILIKEPRICLTFPIWERALNNPVIVFIHRNPIEIAKSLNSRNGFDIAYGIKLWELYASNAIVSSQNSPSLYISYEQLIGQPESVCKHLVSFFEKSNVSFNLVDLRTATNVINSTLKHQSALNMNELDNKQCELNRKLLMACENQTSVSIDELPSLEAVKIAENNILFDRFLYFKNRCQDFEGNYNRIKVESRELQHEQAEYILRLKNSKKEQAEYILHLKNSKKEQAEYILHLKNSKKEQAEYILRLKNSKKEQAEYILRLKNSKTEQESQITTLKATTVALRLEIKKSRHKLMTNKLIRLLMACKLINL